MTPEIISAFILGLMVGGVLVGCFAFTLLTVHYYKVNLEKQKQIYGTNEENTEKSTAAGIS